MTNAKLNLDIVADLSAALAKAAALGGRDEKLGRPKLAGRAVCKAICSKWRTGHVRAMKAAYEAGRFSATLQG